MFSQACVILSVHRRDGGFPACITGDMNKGGLHPEGGLHPGGSASRGGSGLHLEYYRIWLTSRRKHPTGMHTCFGGGVTSRFNKNAFQ